MNKDNKISVKSRTSVGILSLIQVGLMASLVYVATSMIAIPVGNGAVLHLGDGMAFLAAILLGKKKGAAASAIGMTLFDVLSSYIIWAPFTFIIKGVMAYIVGTIAYRNKFEGKNFMNNLLAFLTAGVFMCAGYYVAGGILNHYVNGIPTLFQGFVLALKDIPFNILQILAGVVIALPLALPLKKMLRV